MSPSASAQTGADVIHGHGAKGGAYARLAMPGRRVVRAYTPHGGSLLLSHDNWSGRMYLTLERILLMRRALYLFESAYSGQIFREKIGKPNGIVRVIHNGVSKAEFEPVTCVPDATDLVFIGEFRPVKGIDILIDAIASLHHAGRPVTATLVGSGPDEAALKAQVRAPVAVAGHPLHAGDAGARCADARARHGDSVARRIAALCGAGNRGRRQAADHHQCRRHSGNLRTAVTRLWSRPAMPERSPTRSRRRSTIRPRPLDARGRNCACAWRRRSRSMRWWTA